MSDDQTEIALGGGRVTHGVVRVGNTVRRPATTNSPFVQRLLAHLARRGFAGAPAALGTDERGRDIFAFIAGEVPPDLGHYGDTALAGAAALIRAFHDLSADLAEPPAEVICHNDLSPCNFVFRDGLPVAMIDFDAAAPGTRAYDLGYAAWLWLDFGAPEIAPTEQQRRLRVFVEAYGMLDTETVLAAASMRQAKLLVDAKRRGDALTMAWAADCLAWTRRNLSTLGAA